MAVVAMNKFVFCLQGKAGGPMVKFELPPGPMNHGIIATLMFGVTLRAGLFGAECMETSALLDTLLDHAVAAKAVIVGKLLAHLVATEAIGKALQVRVGLRQGPRGKNLRQHRGGKAHRKQHQADE